jgi:PIN domain nuclease of toxin-antitoxin system
LTSFQALVTDTHPLLFKAAGGSRLSARAAEHFNACDRRQAILYIPAMVMWESFLLHRLGRVQLQPSPRRFFENLFRNPAYQPLDVTPEQIYFAGERQPNDDPFGVGKPRWTGAPSGRPFGTKKIFVSTQRGFGRRTSSSSRRDDRV